MKGRKMTDAEKAYGVALQNAIKAIQIALKASIDAGYYNDGGVYSNTERLADALSKLGDMHRKLYTVNK